MGNPYSQIGNFAKAEKGTVPAAYAGGTRDSAVIDRLTLDFDSCILVSQTGATTGTPDSFSVNAKIQHGDESDGSDMADYVPTNGTAAITPITAANTLAEKDIDLSGAKTYVRVREVTAFVGGTAPTVGVCSSVVLGGSSAVSV